jgi:hypothetical protein
MYEEEDGMLASMTRKVGWSTVYEGCGGIL